MKREVDSLLKLGIIKPAPPDDYIHRIVLVAGRENRPGLSGQQFWMCTDFRAINCCTTPDGLPAPDLLDCLRRLKGMKVFSSLDVESGFHNIPMEGSS